MPNQFFRSEGGRASSSGCRALCAGCSDFMQDRAAALTLERCSSRRHCGQKGLNARLRMVSVTGSRNDGAGFGRAIMEQLIRWISGTALSQAIQNVEWAVPAIQSIHILGVCVVLSSVGMIVLRLMGRAGIRTSVSDTARRYVPWLGGALIVLACTGGLLVIREPPRELTNIMFQIKMLLVLFAIVLIAVFQNSVRKHPEFWNDEPESGRIKMMALSALVLFFAIAVAGRWIAYVIMDYAAA